MKITLIQERKTRPVVKIKHGVWKVAGKHHATASVKTLINAFQCRQ